MTDDPDLTMRELMHAELSEWTAAQNVTGQVTTFSVGFPAEFGDDPPLDPVPVYEVPGAELRRLLGGDAAARAGLPPDDGNETAGIGYAAARLHYLLTGGVRHQRLAAAPRRRGSAQRAGPPVRAGLGTGDAGGRHARPRTARRAADAGSLRPGGTGPAAPPPTSRPVRRLRGGRQVRARRGRRPAAPDANVGRGSPADHAGGRRPGPPTGRRSAPSTWCAARRTGGRAPTTSASSPAPRAATWCHRGTRRQQLHPPQYPHRGRRPGGGGAPTRNQGRGRRPPWVQYGPAWRSGTASTTGTKTPTPRRRDREDETTSSGSAPASPRGPKKDQSTANLNGSPAARCAAGTSTTTRSPASPRPVAQPVNLTARRGRPS